MTDATDSTFTVDSFIAILTDYYEFLRRRYIPDEALEYPPEGGWLELAPERLSFTGKNDTVLETLRRMPYIKFHDIAAQFDIYPGAAALDYTSDLFQEEAIAKRARDGDSPNDAYWDWLCGWEETCTFGPDVFWLADTNLGRAGRMLFIDTTRNAITVMNLEGDVTETGLSIADAAETQEEWREHETYLIPEFFKRMKERISSCELLPYLGNFSACVDDMRFGAFLNDLSFEAYYETLKDLLQRHGWASQSFDKYVCLPKAAKIIEDYREEYLRRMTTDHTSAQLA